jgi:hypothetical protein
MKQDLHALATTNLFEVQYLLARGHRISKVTVHRQPLSTIPELLVYLSGENIQLDRGTFLRGADEPSLAGLELTMQELLNIIWFQDEQGVAV